MSTPIQARSILLAEDEMVTCLFLTECIKRVGHRVVGTTSTGQGAIEKAAALSPDLIIMDVGLKGEMNGVQAADIIHRHSTTPILFMSAFTQEEIARNDDLPDVFHYLPKPVGIEQLRQKLESIFQWEN